ncbi:MAG: polyprenyl synthetase family protein [Halobacteriota archaeon]
MNIECYKELFEEVAEQSIVLLEGQAMDLHFKNSRKVSESEVIEMMRRKTAKLFAVSAKCGAIAGGAPYEVAGELGNAWENIGIASQIRDDILKIEEVINLFKEYGSIRYSEEIAREYLRKGTEALRQIDVKGKSRAEIREKMLAMAGYFVERDK